MADGDSSATSGGLLVILGIVVAVALGYFIFNGNLGGASAPSAPSVSVNLPAKD